MEVPLLADIMDYSSARPSIPLIKTAGIVGVCRYQWLMPGLRPDFNRAKAITKSEYDELLRNGLTVTLNAQLDKEDWKSGYSHGVDLGRASLLHSREMGHPDHLPVILTVQDSGAIHIPTAVEFMRGFVDGRGLGPQAVYGGTPVIDACQNAGLSQFGWKAAASSWSPHTSRHVVLEQRTTKSYPQFPYTWYDENTIFSPFWGQNPDSTPNIPPPKPPEEEIMAFVTKGPTGSLFIVSADLSQRSYLWPADFGALLGAGYKEIVLTPEILDGIPFRADVGSCFSNLSVKLSAILAAITNLNPDVTLTPEQLAVIAAAVDISGEDIVAIAKAVADEDHKRSES
jgi:hypothetical protein